MKRKHENLMMVGIRVYIITTIVLLILGAVSAFV